MPEFLETEQHGRLGKAKSAGYALFLMSVLLTFQRQEGD